MVLFSTQIISPKSYDEVYAIIKAAAYRNARASFSESSFSIVCMRRNVGVIQEYSRISGTLEKRSDSTVVNFRLHAGIGFWIGVAFAAIGAIESIATLVHQSLGWHIPLLVFAAGAFVCARYYWEGKGHIERMLAKIK